MTNGSNYAHKRGGRTVPRKAVVLAHRAFLKMVEKSKQKIVNKAKRG
jgi:hypothetical protein